MNVMHVSLKIPNLNSIHKSLKENPKGFMNTPEVLDRATMKVLVECDMISLYFIKQISSEFEVICENIVTQKEYLENTYIEALDSESVGKYSKLRDAVCTLLSTRDSVYKDGYVDNPSDFNIILPISAFKYKVRAVIKNDAIHKIFSDTIEMVLTGKTDAMGNFIIPNEINPDDTSAICAYRFHRYISNHVSKFIRNSKCELYDIMQREYLSIANMEGIVPDVKIAGIYGTECDIKFFNTTPEKLRENMKNSKKSGSAKITLCVHSTFKDMFSIACQNGVDIVALGDLNSFIKGGIDIIKLNPIMDNYKIRMAKSIADITTSIQELLLHKSPLVYNMAYMAIFNGQMITYVIDVDSTCQLKDEFNPEFGKKIISTLEKAKGIYNSLESFKID